MVLYLIRHGKTEANERHLYCGSTDLPLSGQGLNELRQLRYPDVGGCRFLTSGMLRTEQTLAALFGAVPHTADPDFREVDFGVFEMHAYAELRDRPDYQRWITGDNDANVPPRGESGAAMRRRVTAALERVLAQDRDTVLIAHGGTIAILMETLFPAAGKNRYTWQPAPGHGYRIAGNSYDPIP